jgi:hypothetical protein
MPLQLSEIEPHETPCAAQLVGLQVFPPAEPPLPMPPPLPAAPPDALLPPDPPVPTEPPVPPALEPSADASTSPPLDPPAPVGVVPPAPLPVPVPVSPLDPHPTREPKKSKKQHALIPKVSAGDRTVALRLMTVLLLCSFDGRRCDSFEVEAPGIHVAGVFAVSVNDNSDASTGSGNLVNFAALELVPGDDESRAADIDEL